MVKTVFIIILLLLNNCVARKSHLAAYIDISDPRYFCTQKELSCGYGGIKKNILCDREDVKCGPSTTCGDYFKMMPFDEREQQFIVHMHNEIRHDVAMTDVSYDELILDWEYFNRRDRNLTKLEISGMRHYFPRLTSLPENKIIVDMNTIVIYKDIFVEQGAPKTSYDNELAFGAQCWANSCLSNGRKAPNDRCRKTSKFNNPGQAVYHFTYANTHIKTINFLDMKYIDQALFSWFNEPLQFTEREKLKMFKQYIYRLGDKSMENFIQVSFPKAKYVGCGRVQYGFGNMLTYLIVCNYDEAPTVGKPVFNLGDMCASKCEQRYEYPNLEMMKSRKYCKFDPNLKKEMVQFVRCMYKFQGVSTRRRYQYKTFKDRNPFIPCLCGREKTSRRGAFRPPFEISNLIGERPKSAFLFSIFVELIFLFIFPYFL